MHVSDQGGLLRARVGREERVTPLELFFDLVFVFALTQVTGFLADHLTWLGMLQGAALLIVLWWAWGGYSWLTNAVPAEEVIPARLVILAAMAAMLVASRLAIGAGVVLAAVLGIALAAALWWAYFDLVMLVAGRRLSAAKGAERARLARDSYSYLHLPMVAGIIFVALGVKQTLAHVGDPLGTIPAVALCGGVSLYFLGHNAFRLREVGSVSVPRLVVTVLCCALIPAAVSIPSLITLAILAGLLCALVAFETMRSREFRRELRAR